MDASTPLSVLWPFTGLTPVCLCVSCNGESRTGCRIPDMASPVLRRGKKITFLDLLTTLPNAAQHTAGLLGCKDPEVLFCQPFPMLHWCTGVILPGAGLGPSLCSTPWDACKHQVFSEWQHSPLVYQPLLTLQHCLQICHGCTLSRSLGHWRRCSTVVAPISIL